MESNKIYLRFSTTDDFPIAIIARNEWQLTYHIICCSQFC